MTWKRHGGRKVILVPDGDIWALAKRRPAETLIRVLAQTYWWNCLIEDGI